MKKVIRHESIDEFFARMNSLAQKLDRGEPFEACEGISFEDLEQKNAYLAALDTDGAA